MRLVNQLVILLLACTVTCLVVSRALAQPEPVPAAARPAPLPVAANPYAALQNPYVSAATEPKTTLESQTKKSQTLDKSEHLRLAVEHLSAAGEDALAAQISNEMLIETKLQQIAKLQAEVEQLRSGSPKPQVLKLQLKMIELQTSEMRKLGLDIQASDGMQENAMLGHTLVETKTIEGLVAALRQQKLAKVLAEPTLITVSGRRASFQSGREVPILVPQSLGKVVVEHRQIGTRVDCVGTILKSGLIRFELSATVSEEDASRNIVVQGVTVPGLRTRNIDTAVEMASGQTVVFCGMTWQRSQDEAGSEEGESKSLLVAVTVELVETAAAIARQPQAVPPMIDAERTSRQ